MCVSQEVVHLPRHTNCRLEMFEKLPDLRRLADPYTIQRYRNPTSIGQESDKDGEE